jgi:hypothetical protein
VCDLSYVLVRRRIEQHALNDRIIAGFSRAMGGEVAIPDPAERVREFDVWLVAAPADLNMDPAKREEYAAFGLRV